MNGHGLYIVLKQYTTVDYLVPGLHLNCKWALVRLSAFIHIYYIHGEMGKSVSMCYDPVRC